MAKELWQLTVRTDFAAAHALRHYEGKCENMHGHNFGVELCVEGEKLQEHVEMLVDFKFLKQELKAVLEELDHKLLNETAPFDTINPSSENLARYIYKSVQQGIERHGVRMVSVSVSEKPAQSATYKEV